MQKRDESPACSKLLKMGDRPNWLAEVNAYPGGLQIGMEAPFEV